MGAVVHGGGTGQGARRSRARSGRSAPASPRPPDVVHPPGLRWTAVPLPASCVGLCEPISGLCGLGLFPGDNLIALPHAIVTDEDAIWSSDHAAHLRLPLPTKRTFIGLVLGVHP